MAAGFMANLAGDRVVVLSAGSEPAVEVNPAVVEAMGERGIDVSTNLPRGLTDEDVVDSNIVITMGCGDGCPVLPGKRYLDWELADPAGKDVAAVRPVRDEIERRVRNLIDELGIVVDR